MPWMSSKTCDRKYVVCPRPPVRHCPQCGQDLLGNNYIITIVKGRVGEKPFAGYRKIIIPKQEAYSANCLSITSSFISPTNNVAAGFNLRQEIVKRNLKVAATPYETTCNNIVVSFALKWLLGWAIHPQKFPPIIFFRRGHSGQTTYFLSLYLRGMPGAISLKSLFFGINNVYADWPWHTSFLTKSALEVK